MSESLPVEQVIFIYLQCPDCQFDSVVTPAFQLSLCPVCAEDCGHDVIMHGRLARPDDKPEGADMREGQP